MDDPRARATRALHDTIAASDGLDPGEFVGAWIAVVHLANIDDPSRAAYYLVTGDPDGTAPHVIRGLLHEGLDSPLLDQEADD